MKLTKVAFAIASVLAITAGSANAGQIDSSSATLATEVIYSNAQVVRAPSKSYSFAGDIDARTNEQRLQLQYTLAKGTWATGATGQVFTAVNTPVNGAALLQAAYLDAANANKVALPGASTVSAFLTADAKTLVFNITIPAGAGVADFLLKTPIFSINTAGTLGTDNVGVSNLFDVSGATACVAPDAALNINFKHFTNHTGGTNVLTDASPDSEHLRAGSTNEARLLNFTQNLKFDFVPSSKVGQTDAGSMNTKLLGTNWTSQYLFGTTTAITAPGFVTVGTTTMTSQYYMGFVKLTLRGTGLDTNYANTYGKTGAPVAPASFVAGDFSAVATAAVNNGPIEYAKYAVTLDLPAAWPADSAVVVTDGAGAAYLPANVDVAFNATRTQAVVSAKTATGALQLANGAYLFGQFGGKSAIPQTASVVSNATITKAVPGVSFAEQNNSCAGTFTGIGGGIKIDVRNYAAYATFGASGPATTVRIINNSETTTADVYGQMIYADGTYGAWGQLGSLKPREVMNMANKDVEAKLTNAAAATNPFGAAAVGYEAKGGTAVVGGTKAGISDRLRIVSNTGSTLRVQSYMVVGSTVIDTSNAQGVDFENMRDAVPANQNDAQPISQDAINGLGK